MPAGMGHPGPARILRPMHRRILSLVLVALVAACGGADDDPASGSARILMGEPATLDPAASGDAGSAAIIAQLFETLTAFDTGLTLRPALAASWAFADDGRRVVFQLRPDLAFSDGSPLRASDVVRSWLRIIDPASPSPLASLMLDVDGAAARLSGTAGEESVGLRADDAARTVTVDLVRPAADFVAVVASPTFAVVPPSIDDDPNVLRPGPDFVASGGYAVRDMAPTTLSLEANPHYWAASATALGAITVVTDAGGRSGVQVFESGEVDYAPIGSYDASWIAYDDVLGPQLREVAAFSTDYYGFDTTRPPFDDVRVRRAFAAAIDWRRIALLATGDPTEVATSMVPPGIPGRSDRDVVPAHDPDAARVLLAEAGFPDGTDFPAVTLMTGGSGYDEAIVTELERELGIAITHEVMADGYFDRLETDPPHMWALSWIADFPGRNDFLGVLLATGSSNNYGGWSSPDFDAAIAAAGATTDADAASVAFDRAEEIVLRDAPVVPVSYTGGWAIARDGLLGAGENGLGSLRFAGLAWAD